MNASKKQSAAILLSLLVVVTPCRAQVLTFDVGNLAGIMATLTSMGEQIKRVSEVVGVAREHLTVLTQVSDSIRDLKKLSSGGVQGLLGGVADELGLKDVFEVGKELQGVVTDGMELYRDIRSLPEEAKSQLKGIGLAVDDVGKYLSSGLMYDTFQGMQLDEWRKIFKDPIDALATGAVGRACSATESYLDTQQLRDQYAKTLAQLSPAERARLSGSASVDMAILNSAAWGKELEKRLAKTVNFNVLADKIVDATLSQNNVIGVMKAGNALAAEGAKVQADASRNENDAAALAVANGNTANMMEKTSQGRDEAKDAATAMANAGR